MIGDSITHNLDLPPYKAVWKKFYAPRHALNLGYSGARTENILWNLQNGELENQSPKVAVLLIGTNNSDDANYPVVHTPEEIAEGTQAIVGLLRKRLPQTHLLLLRIFPRTNVYKDGDRERGSARRRALVNQRASELVARLADGKRVHYLDVNHVFLRLDGSIDPDLMPDLLHPSLKGALAWARAMEPKLSELMGDKCKDSGLTSNLVPVPKLEEDCYDWYARHAAVLKVKDRLDPKVDIGPQFLRPDGELPRELMSDFCHPTEQGYAIWAAALRPLLVSATGGTVPLIFDTDMGNDVDDALALALIHTFERHGECRLIAVTLTKDHPYAAPFVDLLNTFYGRGEIPIGVVRGGVTVGEDKYLRQLACAEDNGRPRYPHKLRDGSEAPEATMLLRRVLAAQADGSVVIVQVGFSTNLARLLDSKPDGASRLDGKTLVRRKVRLLSAMAGSFASAPGERFKEFNVATDVASAKKLFQQWPTPIVVSGFEVGDAILYPHRSIEQDYNYVPHHPVAEAYKLYIKMPYDRPTWDLTSVLYAVRSERCPFGLSLPGRVIVEDDGATRFQAEEGGPHRYLTVSREKARDLRDAFAYLCSEPPAAVTERQMKEAEADRRRKFRSTRTTPETRVQLENQSLRLDFDPRTSGTDYNYIWLRRPGTERWERVHNFGVDVGSYDSDGQQEMNCIGMDLSLERTGRTMRVTYPSPLVQYRQFDDRIGAREVVRKYPDFTVEEARRLVHADASVEFRYEIDPQRPSFVLSGRVLHGRICSVVYIIDALWTDNHFLPTHELVEGLPEYDPSRPEEKKACAQVPIEKVRYAIFYRRDGEGVPFALLPLVPDRARVCNYFDNWKCLYDFHTSELNQQFVPDNPPVTVANDTGYITSPRADGTLVPVRVAFFPELGWGQGGKGDELRERIVRSVKQAYRATW